MIFYLNFRLRGKLDVEMAGKSTLIEKESQGSVTEKSYENLFQNMVVAFHQAMGERRKSVSKSRRGVHSGFSYIKHMVKEEPEGSRGGRAVLFVQFVHR